MIRFFHAYHTQFNPRSRLLIVGVFSLFERYLAALHHLVADARQLAHVHFVGHVSDEELVAYYEVADLFLCASEHEGFCVPLVEAFYKQVPVLAYAATAVPATMDGAGVLFDDKDPLHVAALMDAILSDTDAAGRDRRRPARRRRPAAGARTSPARCSGFVERILVGAARAGAARRLRLLAAVRRGGGARGAAARIGRRRYKAPARRADDRQPVGAGGAHAATRSATARGACAICCAAMGHESELYALTIDDDLRGRRAAVQRPGAPGAATSRSSTSRCRRR